MGHVFHSMLIKTKHSRFHGTRLILFFSLSFSIEIIISVARDFIETPSKMLEHWYGSPFVFIDYDYLSYSIPLLGAGNPRFLRNFESLQDKGAAL